MPLARKDIDTISKLKQGTMELSLYDANPESQYFNKSDRHKQRNKEKINQNNNLRYYNNRHHNNVTCYPN